MRKIKEILRLYTEQRLSKRQIARSLSVAYSSVHDLLHRAQAAGLAWPPPAEMDDGDLERLLYHGNQGRPRSRPEPDWPRIDIELRRKGVTLELLWLEYKRDQPDGYQYAQFCVHYRRWRQRVDVVLRQPYRGGEKLFVDYAGQTLPIVEARTGEVRQAQLFVAVLGASNYTYAEAQWAQDLPSWIGGHVRALTFFGGVPEIVVPDNLKAGVHHPCWYEPDLNPTYADWAAYYGTLVLPARPRHPRDRAKVEVGVQIVERWILAVLRHRTFTSLAEANGRSRSCSSSSMRGPSRSAMGAAAPSLRPWTGPHCVRCRRRRTNSRNGSRPGSISITTSSSTPTTTACRTP